MGHFFCGAWGVIAAGMFSSQNSTAVAGYGDSCGVFYSCDKAAAQLGFQIAFVIAITIWVGGMSLLIFGLMKVAGVLRVPLEVEEMGLDESEHGGEGEGKP